MTDATTPRPPECDEQRSGKCPNIKCTYEGWDGERYKCEVCGLRYFLDYEEMK